MLERFPSCVERLPVVTLFLSAAAIVFQILAGLGDAMSFDRTAIAAGEFWRFLSGHLTHWNSDHLAWDVLMFALLGALIERHSRACLMATLLLSATAISVAIWLRHADIEHYRGLSGIDSAFFTLVVFKLIGEARRAKQSFAVWALIAIAAGFVGKVVWEVTTRSTLFVDASAAGFTPLPLVHAVGGVAGGLAWFSTECGSRSFRLAK